MTDPEWMGSTASRLLSIYKPLGSPVFSPAYLKPLLDDGMVKVHSSGGCCLTEKGTEAAEMLLGKRSSSGFEQPDWLLVALTTQPKRKTK